MITGDDGMLVSTNLTGNEGNVEDDDDDGVQQDQIDGVLTAVMEEKSIFQTIAFVCSIITIACSACGIFGNIMSMVIFTRASMRRLSVNVLLTGLSAVDLIMVILSVPTFAVNGLNDYLLDLNVYESYSAVLFFLYPICMIAQSASIYTFVLISVERYYAVCRPLIVKRLLTVRRARVAQLFIFLLAIAYNFVRFFEYGQPSDQEAEPYGRNLRKDKFYFTFYYTSLYLVTHFLIPFTVITALNVRILKRLDRARKERERLSNAQQEQCRTTRMIIVVTIMFGVCNLLAFVINLWELFDFHLFDAPKEEYSSSSSAEESPGAVDNLDGHHEIQVERSAMKTSFAYLLLDLSNTLVVTNAASTFLVCLLYCKRYRKLFWKYTSCLCTHFRRRRDSGLAVAASSSNWSSYALRLPFTSSMENLATIVGGEMRSRSNTVRVGASRGGSPYRKNTECVELERLNNDDWKRVSYVNGLLVLDKDTISRSVSSALRTGTMSNGSSRNAI